jgi:hypothetical protein
MNKNLAYLKTLFYKSIKGRESFFLYVKKGGFKGTL